MNMSTWGGCLCPWGQRYRMLKPTLTWNINKMFPAKWGKTWVSFHLSKFTECIEFLCTLYCNANFSSNQTNMGIPGSGWRLLFNVETPGFSLESLQPSSSSRLTFLFFFFISCMTELKLQTQMQQESFLSVAYQVFTLINTSAWSTEGDWVRRK